MKKLLIKKIVWCLVNCAIIIAMSLKSTVYAFSKFDYESDVLLYNE